MKKTVLFIAVLLIFSVGTAFAGDVWLDLRCPASISVGNQLNAAVDIYASDPSCTGSVSVKRLMVGLGGNSGGGSTGGTLGGVGLWGPYYRSVNWAVPVACPPSPPLTKAVKIIDAVPANLANTMAMVMVSAIDSAGRPFADGTCIVNVLPALQ